LMGLPPEESLDIASYFFPYNQAHNAEIGAAHSLLPKGIN